jgi:GntR family transcriptional regulator, rspAB operon transcriptional repressor
MDAVLELIPALRMDRARYAAPQVFDALRELIVSLELVPGTVLPRAELAAHYGISQTPIRDALMKLGEEGLVDIFPQHATMVSRIDIAAARQAHFLRRSLELEIVRSLAGKTAPEVAALVQGLRGHIERQTRALGPQEYGDFISADREFHRSLYEAAGVGELWQLVRRHSGHVDRLRRLHLPAKGKAEAVVRDHTRIVEAIERREPLAAQEALRSHLAGTLAFVDEIRTRYPAYVTG